MVTTTAWTGTQPAVVDVAGYNAAGWRVFTTNQCSPTKLATIYTYGYDKAGQQRTQLLFGLSSVAMTTTLDAEGLTRGITEAFTPTSPATATWTYYPNDQVQGSVLGTALATTQLYNANSWLSHWEARSTAGATRPLSQSVDYGYAPTGWTTGITTTGSIAPGAQVYSHDMRGRLSGTAGSGGTATWCYDGDGTMIQAATQCVALTYAATLVALLAYQTG